MKPIRLCKGCGRRRLTNVSGLCKRCNKEASKYISKAEMERLQHEHDDMLRAAKESKAAAEAEKAKKAAEAAAAGAAAPAADGEKKEEGAKEEEGAKKSEKKEEKKEEKKGK